MPPSARSAKNTRHRQTDQDTLRRQILLSALPDVAFDGWHEGLVEAAAARAGISVADAESAFPGGTRDLALYLSDWADAEMQARLAREPLDKLRVRERVARGVEIRLDILTPWKQAVSSAICYLGTPPGGLLLPRQVWRTADIIWQAAGDTATDYNRYTKRFLLSGVITATLLYWLGDDSEGHADTQAFLARRIDNVLKVGKAAGSAGEKIKQGMAAVKNRGRKQA